MNNNETEKLRGVVEMLISSSSRINEKTTQKYWYPLSLATYGADEIIEALDSLCSFRTSMWEKTKSFESKISDWQGCKEAVMVNSGSSADLLLTFLLTNPMNPLLKEGDEIIIPVVTWPTHIWSAMMAGLKVKLVDVDPETLNISIDDLKAKISSKTKALFLVHLMGNPCDMDQVQEIAAEHDLLIIEDCCEAMGSKYDGINVGNFGLGGSFSYFFAHHMTTMEGGMVVCNDKEVADQLKILRAHGWTRNLDNPPEIDFKGVDPRYGFINWGFNVRPTELQASFGLHQLNKLDEFNTRRNELAHRFFSHFAENIHISFPKVHAKSEPAWFSIPIMVDEEAPFSREEIKSYLESQGVETRPVVTGNIARHPVADLFPEVFDGSFPGADQIHQRGFYIGLSPMVDDETFSRLIECFDSFLSL